MTTSPPRLLAGATLIFWGGLTGHALVALVVAILLEARSWTGLRWDFKPESYVRAWQFSILCGALVAIVAWMNGMKIGKIHSLSVWAPLILLPLELTQRYGNAAKIPLNTFSFFARKKMEQDIHHGRSISPRMINTGYPYIAVVILATAMASRNELYHFIGLSLVIGACLFFYMRKNGFRPWAWGSALVLVLLLSFVGQWGMFKLYNYYSMAQSGGGGHHTSPNESRTSIGKLGKIKLSPRIFWRMQVTEGNIPKLLRTATYNEYSRARWTHEFVLSDDDDSTRDDEDYIGASTWSGKQENERDIRGFTQNDPRIKTEAPIRLIGEIDERVLANPVPLPHFSLAFGDLGNLGGEASIDCNSLGTVRMHNPDYNVVEYSVWTGDYSSTEIDPVDRYDLKVPPQEIDSVRRICKQLGLDNKELTTREKIKRLRYFFNTEFIYSTHLSTPDIDRGKRQSAVGIFLETTRSGHCEYFATATALLLREAGVPTRYCVGFSVNEKDSSRDEWVMRGKHAHAWCRAWVEEKKSDNTVVGHWEDVDLTPPSWEAMETDESGLWQQKIADWWQLLREDFLIWRTRSTNKTNVLIVVVGIVTLLVLWISWRLWQSRQRRTRIYRHRYQRPKDAPVTALHKLEPLVTKKIGPRPEGVPLGKWLIDIIQLNPALEKNMLSAIELHSVIRFDPEGATQEQHEELASITATLRQTIRGLPADNR